jgi:hypothetical protein
LLRPDDVFERSDEFPRQVAMSYNDEADHRLSGGLAAVGLHLSDIILRPIPSTFKPNIVASVITAC